MTTVEDLEDEPMRFKISYEYLVSNLFSQTLPRYFCQMICLFLALLDHT
jgi:hypothetical protein